MTIAYYIIVFVTILFFKVSLSFYYPITIFCQIFVNFCYIFEIAGPQLILSTIVFWCQEGPYFTENSRLI